MIYNIGVVLLFLCLVHHCKITSTLKNGKITGIHSKRFHRLKSSVNIALEPFANELKNLYIRRKSHVIKEKWVELGGSLDKFIELYKNVDRNIANLVLPGFAGSLDHKHATKLARALKAIPTFTIDTYNILLQDMLRRDFFVAKDMIDSDMFTSINKQQQLTPSTRTMNIFCEACRKEERYDLVYSYYEKFLALGIEEDVVTFPTLVRSTNDTALVLSLMTTAKKKNLQSPILLRCAIETIGIDAKEPRLSLYLAMVARYYSAHHSPTHEEYSYQYDRKTGDALLSSLLHRPFSLCAHDDESTSHLKDLCWEIFFGDGVPEGARSNVDGMMRVYEGSNSVEVALKLLKLRTIQISNKGYVLLFTFIHRHMRTLDFDIAPTLRWKYSLWNENTLNTFTDRASELNYLNSIRDEYWQQMKNLSAQSFRGDQREQINIVHPTVIDSIIRCYLHDVSGMKAFWKREYLPIFSTLATPARRINENDDDAVAKDEEDRDRLSAAIRAGLEAMIYVAGYNLDGQLALEVAKTAAKRQSWGSQGFDRDYSTKLFESFCHGKAHRSRVLSESNFKGIISRITNYGIENNLKIELGISLTKKKE